MIIGSPDGDRLVSWDRDSGWDDLRKLKALKFKEATADIVEVDRVKLSTLDLAEEVVKSIITTLASLKVVCCLRCGAVVCHWAIAWVCAGLRRWLARCFVMRWICPTYRRVRLVILIRVMLTSIVLRT